MSIKIKTGAMSVNDSGTMKDIGMIVADVDSVKDAAIEKIMEELPTDYTELNNEIVTVKEGFHNLDSRLSESIAEISSVTYNNDFVFPNVDKTYNTDVVTVDSKADTSTIHFKATGGIISSSKYINLLLDNLIILKPNTQYTISTSLVDGVFASGGLIRLDLNRRDNYGNIARLGDTSSKWMSNQSVTFTTPNCERYYFTLSLFASSSPCNYDFCVNINISEGNTPNYKPYGRTVDINRELPTIDGIIKKLSGNEKLLRGVADVIVAKDGSGDFTSVADAVSRCSDKAVIFVKNGIYDNEVIKAWQKTVFIIGQSRKGVVIKNNTGSYATPPIEMGTGLLKNLTVYAENDGTVTPPSNQGYALHSESSVAKSSCDFFALENCTFKSDWRQSWGMGMRDINYHVRNCSFERIYFHDCEHEHRALEQNIEFDSCNITAKGDGTALLLQDQQMSSANVNLKFNRCLIKGENGSNISYCKWTGSGVTWVSSLDDFQNWHLSPFSYGNSDEDMNA